ncbi:MAG: deoxyribonuclease IV [Chlamydiota bacterium]
MKKKETILIGAHTSISGGYQNALLEGQSIGANTVQIFTSNQKQWSGHTVHEEEITLWNLAKEETNISHVTSHAGYLINLGSPDMEILTKSRKAFQEEIERCHLLAIDFLVFHAGSAKQSSEEVCLKTIVESLLSLKGILHKGNTRLLIETSAGQGTAVGYSFPHLAYLIDNTKKEIPIGVCIDTCHIFAAGYDIRTKSGWENTLHSFDKEIGLSHLYAFHVNDSAHDLGSRKDRHASLGKGFIGLESFQTLMTQSATAFLPKYLETPDPSCWKEEIQLLQKFFKESKVKHAN